MQHSTVPAPALDWLCPGTGSAVLVVGRRSASLARGCHERRHRVTLIDPEREGTSALLRSAPLGFPVVAEAEALPFPPRSFGVVAVGQGFHTLAPGLALAEFARVLEPGGHLAISYVVRDGSVPWVKRLTARVQADLPHAMRGDYGTDALAALDDHPYFPRVETRSFRLWTPIDRPKLLTLVGNLATPDALDPERRTALLDDVGGLYDSAARAPEPLLLPYQVRCWRAWVDHSDLSAPLELDDGLRITL